MESVIAKFISEGESRYPGNFYLDRQETIDEEGKSQTELIVFTLRLQNQLKELLKSIDDNQSKVLSVECDAKLTYHVNTNAVNLYTRRDSQLPFLADQLLKGEHVRLLEQPKVAGAWTPVAVDHDAAYQAPSELGWIQYFPDIFSSSEVTQPEVNYEFDELVQIFLDEFKQTPYHLGGKTKELGIDCSGFVQRFFQRKNNFTIPRLAKWQALIGEDVPSSKVKPGDQIFFCEPGKGITHTGLIYDPIPNKLPVIVHSSSFNNGLRIDDLNTAKWLDDSIHIAGYKRLNQG